MNRDIKNVEIGRRPLLNIGPPLGLNADRQLATWIQRLPVTLTMSLVYLAGGFHSKTFLLQRLVRRTMWPGHCHTIFYEK